MNTIENGWYYDPAHSGAGFRIDNTDDDGIFGAWYTYDYKGRPLWYLLTPSGVDNVCELYYHMADKATVPDNVTAIKAGTLTFNDDGTAVYSLNLLAVYNNDVLPSPLPPAEFSGVVKFVKTL